MLTLSRAPGSVIGWSNFLKQHTVVDNHYPFCASLLSGVESGNQFLFNSYVLSCFLGLS